MVDFIIAYMKTKTKEIIIIMEKAKMQSKKFKLFDAVLAAVCVTMVVESVAPTAARQQPIFLVATYVYSVLYTLWVYNRGIRFDILGQRRALRLGKACVWAKLG